MRGCHRVWYLKPCVASTVQALAARHEAAKMARTNQIGSPAGRRERASGQTATSPAAGAPVGLRASPRLQACAGSTTANLPPAMPRPRLLSQGRQTSTQEPDDPARTGQVKMVPRTLQSHLCVVFARQLLYACSSYGVLLRDTDI